MSAWQQYVIVVFGTQILGWVDNWPVSATNIINDPFNLTSTPNATIPAGYQITIALQNDAGGNVIGATYVVIDNQGTTFANVTLALQSIAGVNASGPGAYRRLRA